MEPQNNDNLQQIELKDERIMRDQNDKENAKTSTDANLIFWKLYSTYLLIYLFPIIPISLFNESITFSK